MLEFPRPLTKTWKMVDDTVRNNMPQERAASGKVGFMFLLPRPDKQLAFAMRLTVHPDREVSCLGLG
jgi:hypothetical protein